MKFNGRCERHGEVIVTSDGKCDLCLSGQLWTVPCSTCSKPTGLVCVSKCTAYHGRIRCTGNCTIDYSLPDCPICHGEGWYTSVCSKCKNTGEIRTELTPTEAVEVLSDFIEGTDWIHGRIEKAIVSKNGDRIEVER